MKRILGVYIPLVAIVIAISINIAACGNRLPPNTSIEGKTAVRGNQLVQALRATIPAIKAATCQPGVPPQTCIPAATSVKIFEGLEQTFGYAEQAAQALSALDAAKTAQEQIDAKNRVVSLLQVIQKTLQGLIISPESEGTRQQVVLLLQNAMNILIALGAFGTS